MDVVGGLGHFLPIGNRKQSASGLMEVSARTNSRGSNTDSGNGPRMRLVGGRAGSQRTAVLSGSSCIIHCWPFFHCRPATTQSSPSTSPIRRGEDRTTTTTARPPPDAAPNSSANQTTVECQRPEGARQVRELLITRRRALHACITEDADVPIDIMLTFCNLSLRDRSAAVVYTSYPNWTDSGAGNVPTVIEECIQRSPYVRSMDDSVVCGNCLVHLIPPELVRDGSSIGSLQ